MRRRDLWTVTLLVLVAAAGCADHPRADASSRGAAADASQPFGSISGVVADDERRVIPDADVSLIETRQHTTTDGAGRFTFPRVPEGVYTLRGAATGFEPSQLSLRLNPAENAVLRLELKGLPRPTPHAETTHYTGLFQCMVYTLVQVEPCDAPYTTLLELARQNNVNLSAAGAPATLVPNKYHYNFTVRADNTGTVSELAWVPSSDATTYMWLTLTCGWYRATIDSCAGPPGENESATANPVVYAHRRGPSPLRVQWEHPQPAWLPWVMAKASITGTSDQYVGASIDQRFEMYNSVFYGGPIPKGWSIVPSG